MVELYSKYNLDEEVKYNIKSTVFSGIIVGIIFTKRSTYYDIDVSGIIHKSISEDLIQK